MLNFFILAPAVSEKEHSQFLLEAIYLVARLKH